MNRALPIAAQTECGPLSARARRQEWISNRLRRRMQEHDVDQGELYDVLGGVEQSRISRWCNPKKPETIPLHDVIALCRSDVSKVRSLGVALLGDVVGEIDGGLALVDLPPAMDATSTMAAAQFARESADVLATELEKKREPTLEDHVRRERECNEAIAPLLTIRQDARRCQTTARDGLRGAGVVPIDAARKAGSR